VLLACAAALLALSEQKAQAAFPGKNGKIAYVGGVIYTINPGGDGKTKVTNGEEPSYSPNGAKIAYAGYEGLISDDDEDFDHEIYTIKVGGGGKSQVTNSKYEAGDPSWGSRP
jgi:Tol biopolymer transport system component